jgi:hypothetical protein
VRGLGRQHDVAACPTFLTWRDSRASKQTLHRRGCLAVHRRRDVGVDVKRQGDRRVAEDLLDELRVSTCGELQRGVRVPDVVKADSWEPSPDEQSVEGARRDVAAIERVPPGIAFGDFSKYIVSRVNPVRIEVSKDYKWSTDQVSLRLIDRMDGRLVDTKAVAYLVSSNT